MKGRRAGGTIGTKALSMGGASLGVNEWGVFCSVLLNAGRKLNYI